MAEEMRNKYEHMKNQFALNKQISEDFEKKSGRVIEFSDYNLKPKVANKYDVIVRENKIKNLKQQISTLEQ